MLRALRRMRAKLLAEGQTGRYFRYAIGEMVLVVAGILIALELNTANTRRVEQQKLAEYARAMISDLEEDLDMLEPIEMEMRTVRTRVERLRSYVQDTPPEEMSNVHLFFMTRAPYYRPYIWNRAALEQMKASGALRQMRNRELAGSISEYDAFQQHLVEDYNHDRVIAVRALAAAHRVVNMGYPDEALTFPPITLPRGNPFFDWDAFEQSDGGAALAAMNLQMISRDPVLLMEMVNAYKAIIDAYGYRPRLNVEMPMLLEGIQGLIDALEAEYPE